MSVKLYIKNWGPPTKGNDLLKKKNYYTVTSIQKFYHPEFKQWF